MISVCIILMQIGFVPCIINMYLCNTTNLLEIMRCGDRGICLHPQSSMMMMMTMMYCLFIIVADLSVICKMSSSHVTITMEHTLCSSWPKLAVVMKSVALADIKGDA